MNQLKETYVAPHIEVYEMEVEGFIAGSSEEVVMGSGDDANRGWALSKSGGLAAVEEDVL